jgi:hypothetical protein
MALADQDLRDILTASIRSQGDDARPEAQTLIWFLQHVMAVEPLDAYEYVFDEPGLPVDGLLIQDAEDVDEPATLFVFEVKVPPSNGSVGVPAVKQAIKARDAISQLAGERGGGEFSSAAVRLRLAERLRAGDLRPQATLVTTARLTVGGRREAVAANVRVFDLPFLGAVAQALEIEGLRPGSVTVHADAEKRFVSKTSIGRIAVCAVQAAEIAAWEGIRDRSLFGLNVRGQLKQNRVRSGLAEAIEDPRDHPNFLAYHNGLTVVCRRFKVNDLAVRVEDLSVVNGAQSVIALYEHRDKLTDSMEIPVKFVEVGDDRQLPAEVARRSNTQTAVNPRNLRSLDGRQRFLAEDFKEHFPRYRYVTKPDAGHDEPGEPIQNDAAAQWLCSVYAQRPWLAVKRTELFRAPAYSLVFPSYVRAAHIVFCKKVREAVEGKKPLFPSDYRGSWALTTLIALYLASQVLREGDSTRDWLQDPEATLRREDLGLTLEETASFVAQFLTDYNNWRVDQAGFDDFKVDFKNRSTLVSLAADVVRARIRQDD